jgi:putative aldouronate transport system permease protein
MRLRRSLRLGRRSYLTASSFLEEAIFGAVKAIVLTFIVLATLYPFWNTIVVSFNQAIDTTRGGLYFWPRIWTITNFKSIWLTSNVPHTLFISVARAACSTVLNLFFTTMLAYALSRKEYVLRRPLTYIVLLSMYVNAGLFPNYFLIRNLHLNGTFWVYIIPTIISAFNFIVIRTYIKTIPESLFESARIDGTSDFRIFLSFVLPLSKPVLATVALFVAVGAWNAWFDTLLYNSAKPELFTLQYQLMALLQQSMNQSRTAADINSAGMAANIAASTVTPLSIRAAGTIFATVPILVVYPFLQKYFVVGLNVGSIKE